MVEPARLWHDRVVHGPAGRDHEPHDDEDDHDLEHLAKAVRRRWRRWLAHRMTPWALLVLAVVAVAAFGLARYLDRDTTHVGLADDGSSIDLALGDEAVIDLPSGTWAFDATSTAAVVEVVDGPVQACSGRPRGVCGTVVRVRASQAGAGDVHLVCTYGCPTAPGTSRPAEEWRVHVQVGRPVGAS